MKKRTLIVVFLLGVIGLTNLKAQDKFGFFDENYVVTQLPEFKKIKAELDTLQGTFISEIKSMEKKYEEKLKAFEELRKKTDTPPSVLESKAKELDELAKSIDELRNAASKDIQTKQAKSLEPVAVKVKKAVDDISKEQGNIFIFRREGLLYDVEENNISDLVLKKLGITPAAPVANRGNLKSSNKIGYFDSRYAVPQLPDYKKAEADLKVFEGQLRKELENMAKDYEKLAAELNPESPEFQKLTEAQKQAKLEQAQKLASKIRETEVAAQRKMQERSAKAMEPINKLLKDKVTEVAKENGYTFIFSVEGSLYEKPESNISDLVLKKMGITPTAKTQAPDEKKD